MSQLGFELTHRCNLYHVYCDHRIHGSNYELSWEDFQFALQFMNETDEALLIGGESTIHPLFGEMARALLDVVSKVQVKTNGIALPLWPDDLIDRLDIIVQHYPGENNAVVACYKDRPNVRINPFTGWWDPDRDPNVSIEKAKRVRDSCSVELRLYGRRLYGCCLSEGIERHFECGPTWVPMGPDWRDWTAIPTWRACRHCFRAIDGGLV